MKFLTFHDNPRIANAIYFLPTMSLESARSGNRRQNYTKFFNSRTSDGKIHIKFDGFVHCLAFGTRFRFRDLMHRAADREIRLRNSVSIEVYMPHITGCAGLRGGLCTPHGASHTSEWRSMYPTWSIMHVGKWSMYPTWSIPHIGMMVDIPHIELHARLRDGLITPMRGLLGTAH